MKKIRRNPTGNENDAQRISELMLAKKGLDIIIIDVRKITTLTDYFIICTSESDPQTRAIMNHINKDIFKKFNIKPLHIEGNDPLNWVLIDYVHIVVNIFDKKARDYYNIERLWADAKITTISESSK